MQVGRLRRRIKFQRKSVSKDSSGQDVHTWVDVDSPAVIRSASIKPLKGQEGVESRRLIGETLVSIMVRYDPEVAAVTDDDRIIEHENDPDTVYAIHAILNHDERDRWLEFWCTQGLQDLADTDTTSNALYDVDGVILTFVNGEEWHTVD